MAVAAPAPPYVGPAKFHGANTNKPIRRIVIHCTVSPCEPGGARATGRYFHETVTRPSSAHYVVDPAEEVQVVLDSTVAYHAPPNSGSLGVELCDPQTGPPSRWGDAPHAAMLDRAARLVAGLALFYKVPIRKIGPTALRLRRKGICGHVDVSAAWHQTDHTDPGLGFPWDAFMTLVRSWARKLRGSTDPHPVPPPVTPPPPVAPPTPLGPTRVTRFHDECEALIAKYLDPAVADGRTGDVKTVRDALRADLRRLPGR